MLGSRYNDRKERLENRRSSFFLTASEAAHAKHRRTSAAAANATTTNGLPAAEQLRRHTSLDSGVGMCNVPFNNGNHLQDDYGSTRGASFVSENEKPLLLSSARRTKSMIHLAPASCADLSNIDEKPVS
jgi:hypothetical protein